MAIRLQRQLSQAHLFHFALGTWGSESPHLWCAQPEKEYFVSLSSISAQFPSFYNKIIAFRTFSLRADFVAECGT